MSMPDVLMCKSYRLEFDSRPACEGQTSNECPTRESFLSRHSSVHQTTVKYRRSNDSDLPPQVRVGLTPSLQLLLKETTYQYITADDHLVGMLRSLICLLPDGRKMINRIFGKKSKKSPKPSQRLISVGIPTNIAAGPLGFRTDLDPGGG